MQEAVDGLRREFGRDAVVLHTSQKRPWLWGRLGPKRYEVLGAVDPDSRRPRANYRPKMDQGTEQQTRTALSQPTAQPIRQHSAAEGSTMDPTWSASIQAHFGRLVRSDIPRELSHRLLKDALGRLPKQEWDDQEKVLNQLRRVIAEQIVTVDAWEFMGEQRIVVLMGPTGVGKTTTIAKLAANFSLIGAKKVGLITVDTYRIAAVEQLKTYAEIIGIPVQVAYSPRDLKDGITKMGDRDLILIDTAGRSQNNQLQIAELKNYLDGIHAEIHLVISATTKTADVDQIIRSFSQLPIDRVIVTKLDETTAYGVILHACYQAGAPLAFVTTGQGVPEDIDVADGEKIAQLILGDS